MGRKKSLSHHLSRRAPDDTELDHAMKEFQEGSDRVAAIMGSALVEHHLMDAIRLSLADAFNDNVLFHDQGAPFGTFKARIVAGRALGLYGEQMANDLDILRDIRNQFAHALLSISFENPHLVGRCKEFSEHKVTDDDGAPLDFDGREGRKVSETRLCYETMCWKLSIILLQKSTKLLRRKTEDLQRKADEALAKMDRLENSRPRNALADLVAASIEGRAKNVEDDITPDKA